MTVDSRLSSRSTFLRTQISDLLEGQIGTYQLSGVRKDAIAVLPDPDYGYSYPPPGTDVGGTGLEVVLVLPQVSSAPLLDGFSNRLDWLVYLRAHKRGTNPYDAAVSLQAGLPDKVVQLFPIPANEATESPETIRVTISDYQFIK